MVVENSIFNRIHLGHLLLAGAFLSPLAPSLLSNHSRGTPVTYLLAVNAAPPPTPHQNPNPREPRSTERSDRAISQKTSRIRWTAGGAAPSSRRSEAGAV